MSATFKVLGASASIAFILAGCAQQQQQTPTMVMPQPIYNKHGEVVGCEGDGIYDPNNTEYPCDPPDCDQTYSQGYPCDPRGGDDGGGQPVGVPTPVTNIP